ncbi:MAG TPA: Uma2 family endonuclease [Polyangia bacterium]|jgi:Uma2 family endonuclease
MQRRRLHVDGYRDRWPPPLPRSARTHAGFRRWITSRAFPEQVSPTFVDGEIWLSMSPESLETHNKVLLEFISALARHVKDRDLGEVYAERALFTNVPARVSTEPDFLFVSWSASETGRVTLSRRRQRQEEFIEIVGTPDMVLEVLSDSSVRKDRKRLKVAYESARIPEYWLVDARGEGISFEILMLEGDAYRPSAPPDQPQTSRVLGARFQLRRARNRVGRFTYTLGIS